MTLAMQRIEAVAAITFRLDEGLNEAADLRFGVADFGLQHGAATTARAFGGDGAMMWAETWLNDEAALPDPDRAGGVGQAEIIKQLLRALGLQPPHARELSPGLKRRTGSSRPPRSGLRP